MRTDFSTHQSIAKQTLKHSVGIFSLAIGIESLYDLLRGRVYHLRNPKASSLIRDNIDRVSALFAQISFILNGAVSPIGARIIAWAVSNLFIKFQLENRLGGWAVKGGLWKDSRTATACVALALATPAALGYLFSDRRNKKIKRIQANALMTVITSRVVWQSLSRLSDSLFMRVPHQGA